MNYLYNKIYYEQGLGTNYDDNKVWTEHFGQVADRIVADFNPRTFLDAGCAWGYLVAALRDRGVEAFGLDISPYAISQVREDIKPFCRIGSLSDTFPIDFPAQFDMISSIEVIEHMHEEEGLSALNNICAYTDRILFSSTPEDIREETHFNVQQQEYWLKRFAHNGFFRQVNYTPDYISPVAVYLCRMPDIGRVVEDYERWHRQTLMKALEQTHRAWLSNLYIDVGDGFIPDLKVSRTVSYKQLFCETYTFESKSIKHLRFDPVEFSGCIVKNLEVLSDRGLLETKNMNGFRIDNFDIFADNDPSILIETKGQQINWLKISADILALEDQILSTLFSKIKLSYNSKAANLRKLLKNEQDGLPLWSTEICISEKNFDDRIQNINDMIEKERQAYEAKINEYEQRLRQELRLKEGYEQAYTSIANARWWKITKPLRFFTQTMKLILKAILPASLIRNGRRLISSLLHEGVHATWKKLIRKLTGRSDHSQTIFLADTIHSNETTRKVAQDFLLTGNRIEPIPTIITSEKVKRINLVTDSIAAESLLGGVATALIVASEFARHYGYELRIITRTTTVNPLDYEHIMRISGIEMPNKVTYYRDYPEDERSTENYLLDVTPDDVFFATSWWSAETIRKTTIQPRYFYIIQEVETFFYNHGCEHYLCSKVLSDSNIDFIINSHYLYDYFKNNIPSIVKNGTYFEPAFPHALYHPKSFCKKDKYKLFFYARPNNPRNLFALGINLIDRSICHGILNTNEWDIYLAGQPVGDIVFSNGYIAKDLALLSWDEYGHFLSDIDLTISMMYTPHPSYPPFDVACSGGVVVTNSCLNKTAFEQCRNVIVSDLDEEQFLQSLETGIALAMNPEARKANFEASTIPRDWHITLKDTIKFMGDKLGVSDQM